MPKQSGFLQRQQQIQNNVMRAAELLAKQYMIDTLQITLHKDFGLGYDRQKRLMEAAEARAEYRAALDPKDPEADVAQDHLDRAISEILAGRCEIIPFEERSPELKKITYGRYKWLVDSFAP